MNKFQKDLQADAARIDAEVDDALRQRLDARLQSTPRVRRHENAAGARLLGWASAATGLVALAVFILLSNRSPDTEQPVTVASGDEMPLTAPLQVETVDLTGPLQKELTNLQADVALARETIERELKRSF